MRKISKNTNTDFGVATYNNFRYSDGILDEA